MTGAGNQIRTGDLRVTNALLYQLSYPGINRLILIEFTTSYEKCTLTTLCAWIHQRYKFKSNNYTYLKYPPYLCQALC